MELYYTCPEKDAGSTIELRLESGNAAGKVLAAVQGKVTEAHDPPLRGGAEDRVKRTESYVKDFRALKLGKMNLPGGSGKLVLKALEKPGAQVMDVRLLFFTRVSE